MQNENGGSLVQRLHDVHQLPGPSHHFVGLTGHALVEGGEGESGVCSSHGLYAPNYAGGARSKRLQLPCQGAL